MSQSGNIQFNSEKLRKGIKPIVAIKFDTYDGSAHKYYASKTITLDGNSYIMRCKSLPNIHRSLKYAGGISSIGNVSVTLLNQDKETDFLRTTGLGYIMGNALVALIFNDGSTPLWAERLEIFTGKIDDITNISEDGFTFSIFDNDKIKDMIIGTLITNAYADHVVTATLGEIKPIIHGDHPFYYGQDGMLTNITHLQDNNMLSAKYLGIDSAGKHLYLISGHTLNSTNAAQYRAWMFDTRLGRYVKIKTTSVSFSASGNDIIVQVDNLPVLYDYWFPDGTVSDAYHIGVTEWQNQTNSCDLDYSTYAYAEILGDANVDDWAYFKIDFPEYDGYQEDSALSIVNIMGKSDWTTDGAGSNLFVIDGGDATGYDTSTLNTYRAYTDATATKSRVSEVVTVNFGKEEVSTDEYNAWIYMVFKEIAYQSTEMFPVFIACKGYEYGAWINGRATTETDPNTGAVFSVSHPDDDGSGNLIENPVGCIESVAKELLGLNPECLNENTFATHAKWDTTGDWKDTGGNATINYVIDSSMNGNLTQTAANRLLAGENGKSYILKYTCTVTTVPNGDFALIITNAFANTNVSLEIPAAPGTKIYYVKFTSKASASTADFVINASETTATQGNISLDNIYLFRNDIEMNSFNVAANARDGWKFGFAILKQLEATKLLDRMTYEASCWLYWNYANRLEIKAFDETANFTESGAATAISQDIFIHHPDIIALDFDDTDNTSNITFAAAAEHQITGDLTFECWIYFNDFSSGTQMIFDCEGADANEASNRLYRLYKSDANNTAFVFSQEHGANIIEHGALTLDVGLTAETWYHMTLTRITTATVLVLTFRDINAVTIATAAAAYTDAPTGGGNSFLTLGTRRDGVYPFDGKMKEIRLWNDYRISTEITANLYKILTGNQTNLVGYWRLDEGALTTVYDITTYENNGTIDTGCTWSTGSTYPDLGYYAQHLIKENSFKLSLLPTSELANDLTVNYFKNNQSNEYQKTSNTADATSKANYGAHEYQENLDYISDLTTAEALRDDLLYKKKQKWYKVQFTTWTNAANKLEGDIINVRHPILDGGIMTSANMKLARWQIVDIEPDMNSQEITITAIILAIP